MKSYHRWILETSKKPSIRVLDKTRTVFFPDHSSPLKALYEFASGSKLAGRAARIGVDCVNAWVSSGAKYSSIAFGGRLC